MDMGRMVTEIPGIGLGNFDRALSAVILDLHDL